MANPTVRDIAQRAGVSASTVSRALNGYPYVDEETRLSIQKAVKELGYPLTSLRKSQQTSRNIMLLSGFEELVFSKNQNLIMRELVREFWRGARTIFQNANYNVTVQHFTPHSAELQRRLKSEKIDGLMLAGGVIEESFIEELEVNDVPLVVTGSFLKTRKLDYVVADIGDGMDQIVTHLAATGRKNIALVNGPANNNASEQKYNGLVLALHLHGLEIRKEWMSNSEIFMETGYQRTLELINRFPGLDAIVYGDDTLAVGGIRALKECGKKVPQDVAVVGFYDYEIARFTDPPLTSLRLDQRQIGHMAAQRMILLVEAKPADRQPWLMLAPTHLIVRQSSQPS
ncbi:MAG: LacI family DNA-binding transcriptional regulator [Chloroflexi bacterium]|nr:LacI family DNA-binding transcriptional regulator [Chloroflexota bacterium]OJV99332.1 MAG: hypothetical protein BGO39_13925 [Chloroflexi bacterium 54-19]